MGLPARFQPRRQRRVVATATLQRAWLPIAVTASVLVAALVSYAQSPAPAGAPTVVQIIMGATTRAVTAPAPTAAAQPRPPVATAAPAQTRTAPVEHATIAPAPAAAQPAPSTAAIPSPSPSPSPETTTRPSGLLNGLLPQPSASGSPGASPTPFCLPLNLICL